MTGQPSVVEVLVAHRGAGWVHTNTEEQRCWSPFATPDRIVEPRTKEN